jgi:hypothetical protein
MYRRLKAMAGDFRIVLNDEGRKSLPRMTGEFLRCCLQMRGFASHYFTSMLYRKSVTNYLSYMSHREMRALQEAITDENLTHVVSNKLLFLSHFGGMGLAVPNLLGYNVLHSLFTINGPGCQMRELADENELCAALEELAPRDAPQVFIKPIRGSCGRGATKISIPEIRADHQQLRSLWKDLLGGSYLFQDVVRQHPALAELNASSLNTIRIDTFRAPGEAPEILSALLRMGVDEACVDNLTIGGISAGIHLETGILKPIAISRLKNAGKTYSVHPSSGVRFEGFAVPLFTEVKELVLKAAASLPSHLIGWDVAVGPSGPVLIEGNALYYGMQSSDVAYGGYRENPVLQKAIAYARAKEASSRRARA